MKATLGKALRLALIAAGVIGYPLLAHYSTTTPVATELPALGAGVALAPTLAVLAWLAWSTLGVAATLAGGLAVAVLLRTAWPMLEGNFDWLYFLQHAGTNLALAAFFGGTLAAGRTPLVSQLAAKVHASPLSPKTARYTRQVTLAWSGFFTLVCLTSALLFFLAPLKAWSIFANFLTLPLALLMFLGEYLVRRRVLRDEPKHSLKASMMAYWTHPRTDGKAPNPN